MFSSLAVRAVGLLVSIGLSMGIAYACWYTDSEGTFDRGRDGNDSDSDTSGKPTPTAPATWTMAEEVLEEEGMTTADIWGDEWINLTERPTVCNGVLRTKGRARNGAAVSYYANDTVPFVLYENRGFLERGGVDSPIAGFYRPLPAGEHYIDLDQTDIIATLVRMNLGSFELVAEWPAWLPEPEKTTLGIWGFRPGHGGDLIRQVKVEEC